jgi:hypothetical protein
MVEFLSAPEYNRATPQQVLSLVPENHFHTAIFIVDERTVSEQEHPVLVMKLWQDSEVDEDADVYMKRGSTFRALPASVYNIEVNLSLANVDFEEFARAADEDGIFRWQ